MRNHLSFILAALLALVPCTALLAQSTAGDPVVMTINGIDVPRSEFEYSYNKNNGDGIVDKKTVSDYVELFVNYKLKVCAALDARLDTTKAFREEYALYRDQQVRPTMVTDADVLAEARRAYERMSSRIGEKGLILPAHILIALSTKATLAEQDRAKQRIDSIYNALRDIDHAKVWRKNEVPAYLHYGTSSRIGDVVVLPDIGYIVYEKPIEAGGTHGYDPNLQEMHALFRAIGPDIPHTTLPDFPNVCVYNFVCKLLGIEPAPNDGYDINIH